MVRGKKLGNAASPRNGAKRAESRAEMAEARKRLIAEGVIGVLGREGARALTHRRVDSFLGLPEGATSYHCPNRSDLLKAGFEALYDIGYREFARVYRPALDALENGEGIDVQLMAQCACRHWKYIARPANRYMLIARLEFYLLATHDAKFRAFQGRLASRIFHAIEDIFARLGAKAPGLASAEFVHRARGDCVSEILAPSFVEQELTEEYFATRIQQIIDATDAVAVGKKTSRKDSPSRNEFRARLYAIGAQSG